MPVNLATEPIALLMGALLGASAVIPAFIEARRDRKRDGTGNSGASRFPGAAHETKTAPHSAQTR